MRLNQWTKAAALGLAMLFAHSMLHAGPTSANPFGLGIEVGGGAYPGLAGGTAALTGKYWFDGTHALDMNLGGGNDGITVGADYLWHNYRVFRRPRLMALYYGVGGYSNIGNDNLGAGVRGKIGVDWLFPRSPWEVYVELAPSLNLIGGLGFGVGVEGGGRYYFF